ncbi:MAG: hypothetical protein AAF298_05540 [Cyanobacteria bacterium P01_A01_bin.40]
MISRQKLAQEYIKIINNYYPVASRLLNQCLVKVLAFNSDYKVRVSGNAASQAAYSTPARRHRSHQIHYYLAIYYPEPIGKLVLEQQPIFHDAAENMGLMEVIFLNANNLTKDPHSKIRQQDFRFWIELCWLVNTKT